MNEQARDFVALEIVKVLLSHRLKSPINLSNADMNFDMEMVAGALAHQGYQMADAMLYAREQKTHITPPQK